MISTTSDIINNYYGKYDKEGNFNPLGKAVILKDIEVTIDCDDEVYLILKRTYFNKTKTIRVSRGQFAKKEFLADLNKIGVDIPLKHFDIFVDSLRIQEEDAETNGYVPLNVFKNLGWIFLKDNKNNATLCYRCNKLISNTIKGTYIGKYKVKPKGSYMEWKNMVKKEVIGHTAMEIILLAGLSSVIVGLFAQYRTFENPIVHINYQSGKGKSTAALLAVSTASAVFDGTITELDKYGNTTRIESLYGSWHATKNAITGRFAGNNGATCALNELGKYQEKDCTGIVYNLSEGTDKERMTTDCSTYTLDHYATSFISTGESSLLERCNHKLEGLNVRVMEIEKEMTVDGAHANRIKDVCSKHSGHAAPMLAKYILKNGGYDMVNQIYKEQINHLMAYLPSTPSKQRFIEKFHALFLTTALLAKDALGIEFDIKGIKKFMYEYEEEKGIIRNPAQDSFEELISYFHRNDSHFHNADFSKAVSSPWGRVTYPNKKDKTGKIVAEEYEVCSEETKRILKELGYDNPTSMLKGFKDRGLLDCEEGHLTRKRQVNKGSNKKVSVNVFKVYADETDMGENATKTVAFQNKVFSLNKKAGV